MSQPISRKTLIFLFLTILILAPIVTVLALDFAFVLGAVLGVEEIDNTDVNEMVTFSTVALMLAYLWGGIPTAFFAAFLTWQRTRGPLYFKRFMLTVAMGAAAVMTVVGVGFFNSITYSVLSYISFVLLAAVTWKVLSRFEMIGVNHD